MLGGVGPVGLVVVVGAHVTADRIRGVDAARGDGAALLAADVGLLRVGGVVGVHAVDADAVAPAAHFDDFVDAGAVVAGGGVVGDGAGGIEASDERLHRGGGAFAGGLSLGGELLVGEGPDGDAGVVAVAAHEAVESIEVGGVAAELAALVHHQHADSVAGFEQLGCRGIVGAAVGVAAHLLEAADAEILEAVAHRDADAGVVLVVAGALDHVGLAVEQEALFGVEGEGADAELGLGAVDGGAGAGHGCHQLVEARSLRGPELGRGDGGGLLDVEARGGGDLGSALGGGEQLAVGAEELPCHGGVRR